MSAITANRVDDTRPNSKNALQAELTYIVRQDTKPYFESSALTGGAPRVHFQTEQHSVPVEDMRTLSPPAGLDREGFELTRHRSAVTDLYDDDAIERTYNVELEVFLNAFTGADRVAIFDHTRRSDAPEGARNPDGLRGPANRVHVDYTVKSGLQRARDALGANVVDDVLARGGRIVQVNVWRPIKGPVQRAPLALADARSIAPDELIATDQRFPDRTGEIYQLAYAEHQRWFYAPEMEVDEVLLIKGWDSLDDGRARFTPHGAFVLAGSEDRPPRESIETRTYLVFEPR